MKTLVRTMTVVILFMAAAGSAFAQTEDATYEPIQQRIRANMTDEQKQMIEQNQAVNTENREALRATFSEDQLAILQNMELTREEKREALRATFTEEQLAMIQANQEARQAQRQALKSCLTDDQVNAIKQQARQKGGKGKRGGN